MSLKAAQHFWGRRWGSDCRRRRGNLHTFNGNDRDQDLLRLIRGYLLATTGAQVQLVQRRTYQEITAMLLAGQIDATWICGYPFVRHREALVLLAAPVWRGRPFYQS